ncbi:hypothetical protein [Microbacterium sp. NPDC056569]|uniref:DUF4760 domain-containing protein n=1 Tax=Microbacterium sp. NPDC056569 TaxID=3345867 RepID=UPI0036702E8E
MSTPSPSPTPTSTPLGVVEQAAVWGNWAEWGTVFAAILALGVSIAAFAVARRSERRQQFMRVHELLTNPDSQKGRRLLHEKITPGRDIDRLRKRHSDQYDLINRALSLYNTLGIYAYRHYVSREEARTYWAPTIRGSWDAIEIYLRWRRDTHGDQGLWPYLVWFSQECGAAVPADLRLPDDWTPRSE